MVSFLRGLVWNVSMLTLWHRSIHRKYYICNIYTYVSIKCNRVKYIYFANIALNTKFITKYLIILNISNNLSNTCT